MIADLAQGFDYIVVGGGTAGCALAARLSEDAGRTVCLLEAGGAGKSVFIDIPGTIVMAQRSASLNWGFQSIPQPKLDGRRISVPRGRGLGGSALINGMVYFRGNPRDYDAWADAGATGWSYREILPYFRKSEHNENFDAGVFHGRGGPMNVRSVTRPNPLNFSFFDALASLGYSYRDDLNGADSEGMALRQLSIRGGRRETTASAFLQPALGRANLSVLTDTQATRIVLDGRRAVAVEARGAGGNLSVKAHREIVLTAGAIQSPQLLMLSGIGDGEHLRALGIAVRHDLPGVGRNLHDHLASPVHMRTQKPVSYGVSLRAMPRNLWNVTEYLLFRRGPLANNVFESAAFVKSMPGLDKPDVQLVFQPAKRPGSSFPYPLGHGFAISPVGLYPRSRGRVTLASADPFDGPLIDPNLLSAPEDLPPLIEGMRLARKIFASSAFARYEAQETAPGSRFTSDAELAGYIRAEAYTVHHPVGTCRMGSDAAAVVDPRLQVVGLDNLRVADASVFPSITGGNTNAAVVMIAEKACDLILGRPPPAPQTFEVAEGPIRNHTGSTSSGSSP
ncbi:MAG: GMC family oxidoreductase [Steroidobacteraceae bacterium]